MLKLFRKRREPPLRSVLFVCTANVTRSPLAAALFRAEAGRSGEEWTVASAGVGAARGGAPNQTVVVWLKGRGISLEEHRSQPVTRNLLERFRWVLTMERAQRDSIVTNFPEAADRVFVLREFEADPPPPDSDVPDPTFLDPERPEADEARYEELFSILQSETERVFRVLRNRASDLGWGG